MTETLPVSVSSPASGQNPESLFLDGNSFEHGQRIAKMLASSDLVPAQFRGNIQNCLIALELASRTGSSPMAVMQNLYIVHGKPTWAAQFIIACLNSCGKFSPLRFEMSGEGDNLACKATAIDLGSGEQVEGPTVSIGMAKKEGWYQKSGSKWPTMPELMLRYRSATFFGRLFAPEILLGMSTSDELQDIQRATRQAEAQEVNDLLKEGDA